MPASIIQLPAELIQEIHFFAQNPFLPQTCSSIYASLHRPPPSYAAKYLLRLYELYTPEQILSRSLRHPVCGLETTKAIERIWDRRRQGHDGGGHRRYSQMGTVGSQLSLTCRELPRRLFRETAPPSRPIHPLVEYLFDTYAPSPDSHKGYPLCRAVLQRNYALVRYLLSKGADPGLKNFMAVEIAVSLKDLALVKLLIEREPSKGRKDSPAKRAKLEDRIVVGTKMVEAAIKKGANDIVNYLVYDKKVMPPLRSIMDIGKSASVHAKPTANPPKGKKRVRTSGGFR